MKAAELIRQLQELPPDREVLVDVTDIGFLDILGIDDPGDEYPGVAIMLEGNPMIDEVRRINSHSL
jgi:hypothetical protein